MFRKWNKKTILFLIYYLKPNIDILRHFFDVMIITDIRFPIEITAIKDLIGTRLLVAVLDCTLMPS